MADSNKAIDHLFKVEGGYIKHPLDPGGATKYGITQRTLDNWQENQNTDSYHVAFLDKYEARQIYKEKYWEPMRLEELKWDNIALILLDQGVNQGPRVAVQRAQRVLNEIKRGCDLKMDGILGKKTLKEINTLQNPISFCIMYVKYSQLYYIDLVKKNKKLLAFIKGWIMRSHRLLDLSFAS